MDNFYQLTVKKSSERLNTHLKIPADDKNMCTQTHCENGTEAKNLVYHVLEF